VHRPQALQDRALCSTPSRFSWQPPEVKSAAHNLITLRLVARGGNGEQAPR
jgi:hypothetical protein